MRVWPAMRTPGAPILLAVVLGFLPGGCGSSGSDRRRDDGTGSERTGGSAAQRAELRAIDRAYLGARREERSCTSLRESADTSFSQRAHGPALDAAELLLAFCPAARVNALETTQVILARNEARSGGPSARTVHLRLALPLPA